MANIKLKNVDSFIDRHGKPRHYYRQGRGARVRLPGEPGSAEFTQAYRRAAEQFERVEGRVSDVGSSAPTCQVESDAVLHERAPRRPRDDQSLLRL